MSRKSLRAVKDNGAAAAAAEKPIVPLEALNVEQLRGMCDDGGIVISQGYVKKGVLIKLLKDSGGGAVSVSGQGAEVSLAVSEMDDTGHGMSHTKPHSGRMSPPPPIKRVKSEELMGIRHLDSEFQDLIQASERSYESWKKQWRTGIQPWSDIQVLEHIFYKRMMPRIPRETSDQALSVCEVMKLPYERTQEWNVGSTPKTYPDGLTLILLVGSAGTGKTTMLNELCTLLQLTVGIIKINPDELYEWFGDKFGTHPPKIVTVPKNDRDKKKNDSILDWYNEHSERSQLFQGELDNDVKRQVAEYGIPKAHGVLGQYGEILPRMNDMIINGAKGLPQGTGNSRKQTDNHDAYRYNVLLDTTGRMKGTFLTDMIEHFKSKNYRIVVCLIVSTENECIQRVTSTRNALQHRKLNKFAVGNIWDSVAFRDPDSEHTPTKWANFECADGVKPELIIARNNWTPENESGRIRIVYHATQTPTPTPTPSPRTVVTKTPDKEINDTTGIYFMNYNSHNKTFNYDAGAAEAAEAAKKARAGAGAGAGAGGYSRKRRLHTNRPRKTMKKYARRVTRRRGGRGRGRRSQRR